MTKKNIRKYVRNGEKIMILANLNSLIVIISIIIIVITLLVNVINNNVICVSPNDTDTV